MNLFQEIKNWLNSHPSMTNVFNYLIWVVLIILSIQLLRRLLKRKIENSTIRYKSQKGIEVIGYVFLIFLTVSYFTGTIKDFTLIIGLFTAGLAFTLQELILSVAGSIYIFFVKVYQPGDRIEINGIKGDVIDIDSIYTTMMEIGEWVSGDNYSGRIVKLSNAFVFKGPIHNYSQDFPFIWDEFYLPIRYGSDLELAKSIILKVAKELLYDYATESKSQWQAIVKKYYVEDAQVESSLAITLTDNWLQCNLRYIVNHKKRRSTKNLLNEKIYQEIMKTNGKVILSSATVEVIKLPDLNVNVNKA